MKMRAINLPVGVLTGGLANLHEIWYNCSPDLPRVRWWWAGEGWEGKGRSYEHYYCVFIDGTQISDSQRVKILLRVSHKKRAFSERLKEKKKTKIDRIANKNIYCGINHSLPIVHHSDCTKVHRNRAKLPHSLKRLSSKFKFVPCTWEVTD